MDLIHCGQEIDATVIVIKSYVSGLAAYLRCTAGHMSMGNNLLRVTDGISSVQRRSQPPHYYTCTIHDNVPSDFYILHGDRVHGTALSLFLIYFPLASNCLVHS